MANSKLGDAHGLYTAESFRFMPEEPLTNKDVQSGVGFLCKRCDYQHCPHHHCPEFCLPPIIRREKWCLHKECCYRRLRLCFCSENRCINNISSIRVVHNSPHITENMIPLPQFGVDNQEFCYMKTFREENKNNSNNDDNSNKSGIR